MLSLIFKNSHLLIQKDNWISFKNPCIVKLVGQPISEEEDAPIGFKIRLQPWMPLSKSKDIPVVMDWVVSIVEPVEDLKSTYENALSDEQALNGEENEA